MHEPMKDHGAPLGVLSSKTGEALEDYLASEYKKYATLLFDANHILHTRSQEKIGAQLLQHRDVLERLGIWPASLPANASARAVAAWVVDNAIMMIPDDHVGMVRSHMGFEYWEQYRKGAQVGRLKPGLDKLQVAPLISELVARRFISSGLKVSDYQAMADVAGRLPAARDAVVKRGHTRPWPKEWGEPPRWTRTIAR
jgi:hypothetical protein